MRISDEARALWAPKRIIKLFLIYMGIALTAGIIVILINMTNEALK